ncbi:methyltransferase, putative [Bodo saltans]|uniref:Methyltransferase, putative n=1 Tax=Bodo saltans TaxID=75058 RepID=A0A0S4JPH0_BODSA|nr:methyltransferase, putative [Bodo saltans]|eukprot:CUG91263.1 methyltransferase, putative [Bodo saltans]
MSFYSTSGYWDERYRWANDDEILEDTFDWYVPYAIRTSDGVMFAEGLGLREEILSLVPKQRSALKVLILGCGTSSIGEMMYDDGFRDVLCVDFSEQCIARMTRRQGLLAQTISPQATSSTEGAPPHPPSAAHAARGPIVRDGLRYQHMDGVALLEYIEAGSIDLIIDKAMLDASFCDNDVQKRYDRIAKLLENVYDALRPSGTYLHITSNKETGGSRGVLFRNPVLPWSNVSVVKLDLGTIAPPPHPSSAMNEALEFFSKPYWMFCIVK